MPAQVIERPFTTAEQNELERIIFAMPTPLRRWKQGAENALVIWAVSMLGVVLAWLLMAWVVRKLAAVDFGWNSPFAPWVLGLSTPIVALIAGASTMRVRISALVTKIL